MESPQSTPPAAKPWSLDGPRPAATAAIVSGLAWLVKYALIDANGGYAEPAGTGTEAFWIPAFYLLGLATLLIAGGLAAYALARRTQVWARIGAAAVGAFLAFLFHNFMDTVGSALYTTDSWQRDEISIWLTAIFVLVAGLVALALAWRSGKTDEAKVTA